MNRILGFGQRVELIYLATLRIVILVLATLAVIAAAVLAINGARKVLLSTNVTPEPVAVAAGEVLTTVAAEKPKAAQQSAQTTQASTAAKAKFDAFMRDQFAPYHAVYARLARAYNKPEDTLLSPAQLASELGYTLETYEEGLDGTLERFVDDQAYAQQLQAVATALGSDERVGSQLQRYKVATKSAQACSTVNESRRVWDSNSMACTGWWMEPIGCEVTRQVPVQKCVAAYPDGITSPLQAFKQMDAAFRHIWTTKAEASGAKAEAQRTKLTLEKASGAPTLMQAAAVFGGFLAIMFLFLTIAVERHLRRLAEVER